MKRRAFLKTVGGAVGAGTLASQPIVHAAQSAAATDSTQPAGLPLRTLGRTGRQVSLVGFPGLALSRADQAASTAGIRTAFERGVNYFDVAPAYGDAEIKMGIGLEGIDRNRISLACKTKMRDKKGAREELERSLARLKTDHFDLYQMHALMKAEDVERAFAADGAMETILQARDEGKLRHIGFSAHTTVAALAAMKRFQFDTVMFPVNFIEYFSFDFGKQVLDLASDQGAAVVAIKPMCGGDWTDQTRKDPHERTRNWYRTLEEPGQIDLALRFTLSHKSVAVGMPPGFLDLLDKAIEAGRDYRPITEDETEQLRELAAGRASLFRKEQQVADVHTPCGGCAPIV